MDPISKKNTFLVRSGCRAGEERTYVCPKANICSTALDRSIQIFLVILFASNILYGQTGKAGPTLIDSTDVHLTVTGTLPKILQEASGLEITTPGRLWTHNDDRFSVLYALDTLGNILTTIHLNHPNAGWEDLTCDKNGNFYIGSFGNNKNERKNLAIYKLPDPENIQEKIFTAGIIQYFYPDQHEFPPPVSRRNFDADAFVSLGDSLYIFTKNRTRPFTGYSKVYRLPQEPGKYEAFLYDSIYLGNGPMMEHWVTSADVSPDGKWLVLLSHDCIWIICNFENKRFSSGRIFKIDLQDFSHKAGLCFVSNSRIFLVDELELGFLGGKIYSLDLSAVFSSIQSQTVAPLRD